MPSSEHAKEYTRGAKLLKHDQLDSANTNGILLSKPSPSKPSSFSLSTTSNKPLLPYEQPKEHSRGPKLLKHDQLDNANTNGILLSKPPPSKPSSSSLSTTCIKPPLPSYEQSKEYRSGPNLFKHDQVDNASTNGISLSKSSPTTLSSSSLSTTCNKRVVLCGVNYRKRKFRIKGTINDVVNMKELLIKNFKFPSECIRVITEQEDPNLMPTRRNILESLKWLVKDCRPGDSLVFYLTGHGLRQADFDEDENDAGFDETLCPVDFVKEGMITEDDINSTIIGPLKEHFMLLLMLVIVGQILILVMFINKKIANGIGRTTSSPLLLENIQVVDWPFVSVLVKIGRLLLISNLVSFLKDQSRSLLQ